MSNSVAFWPRNRIARGGKWYIREIMHEFQIQIIHSFMLQLQEKILEIIIVKLKFLNFVFLRFYIVYFFALNI